MGIGDTGIATGGIQQDFLRCQLTLLDGFADDAIGRPGLYAAGQLHPFFLGIDLHILFAGQQPEAAPRERVAGFEEVVGGLTEREATFEARRCLSCGNCCECDGCLGACPEDAVIKLGPGHRYEFNYDRCTGCGACFEQCPVHSIEMVPED